MTVITKIKEWLALDNGWPDNMTRDDFLEIDLDIQGDIDAYELAVILSYFPSLSGAPLYIQKDRAKRHKACEDWPLIKRHFKLAKCEWVRLSKEELSNKKELWE